jgi:hypothetical protein
MLILPLAACASAEGGSPSATAAAATVAPSATTSAEATASASPTAEPTESAEASDDGAGGDPGGFSVIASDEADELFGDPDDCENLEHGYRVEFPEEWYTNTEIGEVPPCVWFSPTFYEVDDPAQVPAEIAIRIDHLEGDFGYFEEPVRREEVIVGGTQEAVRLEFEDSYVYVVQLGPTPEEGPNLVARTDTDMGGDFELNMAVLDRIMASMELLGTIQ